MAFDTRLNITHDQLIPSQEARSRTPPCKNNHLEPESLKSQFVHSKMEKWTSSPLAVSIMNLELRATRNFCNHA